MKLAHVLPVLLLFLVPLQADAWIDRLYGYEENGLISRAEMQTALDYLWGIGFTTYDRIEYSVERPGADNWDVPMMALYGAIGAWETDNPGLKFVETDGDADVRIVWIGTGESDTYCDPDGTCTISVSLADHNCNGEPVRAGAGLIQNAIMHGLGHVLGLQHTSDKAHLMYHTDGIPIYYRDGYAVPDTADGSYAGQAALADRIAEMDLRADNYAGLLDQVESEFSTLEAKRIELVSARARMDSQLANIEFALY